MPIILQPEQEQFIQAQLATGRYTNATEIISEALELLERQNHCDSSLINFLSKLES